MKNVFKLCAMAAVGAVLCGCSSDDGPADDYTRNKMVMSPAEQEQVGSINTFGMSILQHLAGEESHSGKNLVFSPLSASVFTGMLANGATPELQGKVAEVMGMSGGDVNDMNSLMMRLSNELPATDRYNCLSLANGIWVDPAYTLKSGFVSQMNSIYGAEISNLALGSDNAESVINGWCSDHTGGMIKNVYKKRDGLSSFMANAMYFKGEWESPFKEADTYKAQFTNVDGTQSEIDMMSGRKTVGYARGDNFTLVTLDYKFYSYYAVFVVPDEGVTPSGLLVSKTSQELVDDLVGYVPDGETLLSIPKLDFSEQKTDLKGAMASLGLEGLFSPQGDSFPGISDKGFVLNGMMQHSALVMDEKGTKAASVTGVLIETSTEPVEVPKTVTIDRPYILLVIHSDSRAVVTTAIVNRL